MELNAFRDNGEGTVADREAGLPKVTRTEAYNGRKEAMDNVPGFWRKYGCASAKVRERLRLAIVIARFRGTRDLSAERARRAELDARELADDELLYLSDCIPVAEWRDYFVELRQSRASRRQP